MSFRNVLCSIVMVVSSVGCTAPLEAPERDPDSPIQTDAVEYQVELHPLGTGDGGEGLRGSIPHVLTNATDDTLYDVAACGASCAVLEKRTSGDWEPAWSPFVLGPSRSSPRVLAPGEAYGDTFRIIGYPFGSSTFPAFQVADIDGIYRLRWTSLRRNYRSLQDPGDPVDPEDAVSNPFLLREVHSEEAEPG